MIWEKKSGLILALFLASLPQNGWSWDRIKGMADDLCEGVEKSYASRQKADGKKVLRAVVFPFVPEIGSNAYAGIYISERLTSQLAGRCRGIELVERTFLERILAEHKLGETGALDQKELAKLGSVLQAEALITGSYSPYNDSGDKMDVNVRVVTIEKGEILAGSRQSKIEVPANSHGNVNAKLGNLNPVFQQLLKNIDSSKAADSKDNTATVEGVPAPQRGDIFSSANFKKCVSIYSTSLASADAANRCFRICDSFTFADNPNFDACHAVYDVNLKSHDAADICINKIQGETK